jgi:hypothetical protein
MIHLELRLALLTRPPSPPLWPPLNFTCNSTIAFELSDAANRTTVLLVHSPGRRKTCRPTRRPAWAENKEEQLFVAERIRIIHENLEEIESLNNVV